MDRDDSRQLVKRLVRDLDLHEDPGELTELLDRATKVAPGGVHTSIRRIDPQINFSRAEGAYIYSANGQQDKPADQEFDITVPKGRLWVMGDHRSNSRDSRANDDGTGAAGSVPRDNVVGQAFVLLFPLDRITWFSVPEAFADVPEAAP